MSESGTNNCVTREVTIVNSHGLHARPVMRFVDLATAFEAQVVVDKGQGTEQVDGKSPMHMMLLAAPKGTRLRITARGADAEEALRALAELVESGFADD
jgi:phosphocarrier protein